MGSLLREHKERAKTNDGATTGSAYSDKRTRTRRGTFRIVDTDRIGHDILLSPRRLTNNRGGDEGPYSVAPGESVFPDILKLFGDAAVDNKNILTDEGQIDRRKLGEIIFQDNGKRRLLNRITHPRIIRVMLKQIASGTYFGKESVVCADVPLLFESGLLRWLFALTIVVACDSDLQFERLRNRNLDLSSQQCRDRIASQMPIREKVTLADIVIWNNRNLDDLSEEVERVRTEIVDRLHDGPISLLNFVVIFGAALLGAMALELAL